ncbi:MAG TPA: 50S ribosomal protein L18 [Candidatus Woesearchaeota archaeon]|nr:50S ribosomal protein L18 [Candidatus Woesearchaeota archaeon]
MAKGPTYIVKYRRKRKGLTYYQKRLRLLKSRKVRFVVRKSSNNLMCQMVEYHHDGDKTLAAFDSLKLKKYGYKGHTGNLPASYLAGYACGLIAQKKGIKEAILDTGLYPSTKGSRLYSALKGLVDSGIEIPHGEKILPQERRIQGYHIADYAAILNSEKPEEYEKLFSKMLKEGVQPEKFVEHFEQVKKRITGEFTGGIAAPKKLEGGEE